MTSDQNSTAESSDAEGSAVSNSNVSDSGGSRGTGSDAKTGRPVTNPTAREVSAEPMATGRPAGEAPTDSAGETRGTTTAEEQPDPSGAGAVPGRSAESEAIPVPVSRETLVRVFGEGLPVAEAYTELLAGDGVVRGLLGPREVPRLWERHLLNCAVLGELVPQDADVLDIGSGAGLPGIPLAIARPDLWVTLVEPMERRTSFLAEVIEQIELSNVEVLRSRAEAVSPKGKADVVTSRAVAPLGKLANWCLPLARPGGQVLAIKGSSAPAEIDKYLAEKPGRAKHRPEVIECGVEFLATPTTVIRLLKGDPAKWHRG